MATRRSSSPQREENVQHLPPLTHIEIRYEAANSILSKTKWESSVEMTCCEHTNVKAMVYAYANGDIKRGPWLLHPSANYFIGFNNCPANKIRHLNIMGSPPGVVIDSSLDRTIYTLRARYKEPYDQFTVCCERTGEMSACAECDDDYRVTLTMILEAEYDTYFGVGKYSFDFKELRYRSIEELMDS